MAVRRAQVLTKEQYAQVEKIVRAGEHPLRDEAAVRLSYFAGLRAGEIAKLRWKTALLDVNGDISDTLRINSDVGKRAVERVIPLDAKTIELLKRLRKASPEQEFVFYALHNNITPTLPMFDRKGKPVIGADGVQARVPNPDFKPGSVSPNAVVQFFKRLYAKVGFEGASSHSGRRTFITQRARVANNLGCSLRDVQELAGHRRLETTAAYIEPSNSQRKLVAAW